MFKWSQNKMRNRAMSGETIGSNPRMTQKMQSFIPPWPNDPSPAPHFQCNCNPEEALPFLDKSCRILDGQIVTDLYRKETDRNQYLLTSSCHSSHVTDNIPFSLALRIVRICLLPADRDKRLRELKELLLVRNYKKISYI